MKITLPNPSLVVLIGSSGAGKSTFARRHFLESEIISSDACRALVCDDENSLEATNDAFDVLHYIAAKRLQNLKTVVIDATNVQKGARASLLQLARKYHLFPIAIVLDVPEKVCLERNAARPDRNFGPHVVRNHIRQLKQGIRGLEREGFRSVHILRGENLEDVEIVRTKLFNDKREETGPFDMIGDVHGCADELELLLEKLGYARDENGVFAHAENRKVVFLGDLVDRGPRVGDVLEIARMMIEAGTALGVAGNHDEKLLKYLRGKKVSIAHGLDVSIADLEARGDEFKAQTQKFLDSLVSHYVLDGGQLVVAHAGLTANLQGRASGAVRAFCLYGETTGETDEFGLPVRYAWANDYRGKATVVYGHTPVPVADWQNNTLNIDTGCVFGGELTALRWPEREILSVKAKETYVEPVRPLNFATPTKLTDDVLDFADVSGKRIIETRLSPRIAIQAENGAAALEILSRFGADPRWLITLPPTMSPTATAPEESGVLEHPATVWEYFRENGVQTVVCEEKHMGSRAVTIICRDEVAALRKFGVEGEAGIVFTRTGRRFFADLALEAEFLARIRAAISEANWWERFNSDWFCLDAEIMPWSAKAQELLDRQYAPVAEAGIVALDAASQALTKAASNGIELGDLQVEMGERKAAVSDYKAAYERYCWPVESVEDFKFAPFHLLASEGKVHTDQTNVWHMETLAELSRFDKICVATPYRVVNLNDENEVSTAEKWWEALTASGGEGMVVKPLDFLVKHKDRLVQPALKCRGSEYLRIIYGPEYLLPQNLKRLRRRALAGKRSLAIREFSLGLESLERFVANDSLRRVHECVWGVLALESEPIDPRL